MHSRVFLVPVKRDLYTSIAIYMLQQHGHVYLVGLYVKKQTLRTEVVKCETLFYTNSEHSR